ncbi:seed imbibition 1-like, raffinose synthase 5 [Hibiscus trionum]|uniref:Seed imbibition 1-like, raffinose synthase 5 n=1 Tax=Hibiscus trionum TaxID=183268 RepID=A0A9W7MS38_HIBTR|nr:seed imbibition 1-like, raffinose synthase 5 [Hibiscus trionum]
MAPSLSKANSGASGLVDGHNTQSLISLEGSNFAADGHVFLTDVHDNITLTPAPCASSADKSISIVGSFVGFDAAEPHSRHVVPIGKLRNIKFMSIFRFKVWWTTQWVSSNGKDLENETQIVILDKSDSGRPYVLLLPLLEGPFRASLQPGADDNVDVCVESGSTAVTSATFQSVVYIHVGEDPFNLVKEAVKVVNDHLGTF